MHRIMKLNVGHITEYLIQSCNPSSRAHNTLFISELASQRNSLPEDLRTPPAQDKPAVRVKADKAKGAATALKRKTAALEYESE